MGRQRKACTFEPPALFLVSPQSLLRATVRRHAERADDPLPGAALEDADEI